MTFSATPKFIVATRRFSYPKSAIFVVVLYRPFLQVSTKKILIKSPMHVNAHRRTSDSDNNQHHTQCNNNNKESDAAATTILKG
jgi:hypothetical protein